MERQVIRIWTDGSCNCKTRLGGSACYIQWGDKEYFLREGGFSNTTIERREIYAIIMALRAIKKDVRCQATFYVDRENVVNYIKDHQIDWASGKLEGIPNKDLWDELFQELNDHKRLVARFKWVAGHQKDYDDPIVVGNCIADALANYKGFDQFTQDLSSGQG